MSDLSDILLGKKSSPKATYSDYLKWVTNASADDEISKKEWREGADQFGFNARRARRAFKNGKYDTYANPYINKLKRNYYAWRDPNTGTVSLIGEGDTNYNEEAFQNSKFKGTDKASVVQAYNDAVDSARKKANIVYEKDGKYYITYKVGDWDVTNLDVTDADWFKDDTDRQKKAQLYAYGQDVDNYDSNAFSDYLSDDGTKLLSKINYNSNFIKDFDKKDISDQETIKNNIGNSLIQYYKNQAGNSWNSSVKADALWKKLMEYYNTKNIKWLPQLTWQDKSRYQDYTNLGDLGNTNSTVRGNLLSFKKKGGFIRPRTLAKGGMIPKAGWGTSLLGDGWLGQGADLVTDFVPIAGTVNRIYDGTLKSPGEIALSFGPSKKTAALFGLVRAGAHNSAVQTGVKNGSTDTQNTAQNNSSTPTTEGTNVIAEVNGNQYIQNEDGTYTPIDAINPEYSNQVNFKS